MYLESFETESFKFKNYIECSIEEHFKILETRNNIGIRMWMANNQPISEFDHINFVQSLKRKLDRVYFAVFHNNQYIASIYMTDIEGECGERGIYVAPSYQGKGMTQNIEFDFLNYLRHRGFKYVLAKVKVDNKRSIHYHIKMGYKEETRDNEYIYYKLEIENEIIKKVNT